MLSLSQRTSGSCISVVRGDLGQDTQASLSPTANLKEIPKKKSDVKAHTQPIGSAQTVRCGDPYGETLQRQDRLKSEWQLHPETEKVKSKLRALPDMQK